MLSNSRASWYGRVLNAGEITVKVLVLSLALVTGTGCALAQSAPTSAAQYYQQMQQKIMAKMSSDKSFVSGGQNIGGSVYREGNTYEISDRRYAGEPQDVQVFDPMKARLPQFLIDATSVPASGLATGSNSIPQFIADKNTFGNKREEIAGRLPMFVPETIQADWNNMWRSVGHAQTKEVWGGTVVRYANQVTYRSPGECQRGCTFSILDNPMAVAGRVQSIRKYWEEHYTVPLNGDTLGIEQDPWARNMRPVTPNSDVGKRLQYSTNGSNNSPLERTRVDALTTWSK